MPFRDAGRGRSDFNLSIQDCLWGMYKAMQNGLCDLNEFDISEYEFYEKVENGDWNWISPHFIALASPMDPAWIKNQKDAVKEQLSAAGALISPAKGIKQRELALQRKLPTPFQNCIDYFEQHNIKIVVRLNNPLYDRQTFLDRGINHMELYFDDGTNPSDEIVRRFIDISDEIIQSGGVVAVHVSSTYLSNRCLPISCVISVKPGWDGRARSSAPISFGNMDSLQVRQLLLCASCALDAWSALSNNSCMSSNSSG